MPFFPLDTALPVQAQYLDNSVLLSAAIDALSLNFLNETPSTPSGLILEKLKVKPANDVSSFLLPRIGPREFFV